MYSTMVEVCMLKTAGGNAESHTNVSNATQSGSDITSWADNERTSQSSRVLACISETSLSIFGDKTLKEPEFHT